MNRRLRIALITCASIGTILITTLYLVAAYEDQLKLATSFKQYLDENGIIYCVFFGISFIAGLAVIAVFLRTPRVSLILVAGILLLLSLFALTQPEQTRWIANYFSGERIRERHAIRLEHELNQLPEYSNVQLNHSYWPRSKGEILTVSGDVPTQSAYDKLVVRIENTDGWFVSWKLTIDGRNPRDIDEHRGIAE